MRTRTFGTYYMRTHARKIGSRSAPIPASGLPRQPVLRYPSTASSGAVRLARRRKKQRLDTAKEARRRARAAMGQPPRERVVENKRRKPPKYRKQLLEAEMF